ncbi:MAG: hypothetical protein FDW93_02305 [Bergeyella sp.]|nr:hypothetical protein [Bergeyella sp.]
MTEFWLLLSRVFSWVFLFFDFAGYFINWVLFVVGCVLFVYWCYVLLVDVGGNKDKGYSSSTEGKNPYYDPKIMRKG